MAGPVCLEQHLDRHVETGHLTVEVLIQRTVRFNKESGVTAERGVRAAGAHSKIVMKTYTLNKGVEVIGGKVGNNLLLLEEGDQIELNGTLHRAYGTGIRIINANAAEHSIKRELCTTFKAIPHDLVFRKIRGTTLKASVFEHEIVEITETTKRRKNS